MDISYVCDDCDGTDPDCHCQKETEMDCDHKGGMSYWCGFCIPIMEEI